MNESSKSNQVAQATNGNEYEALEMPLLKNGIRMEIDTLKNFCNDRSLPIFSITVGETVHGGVAFPVNTPYKKYFTIYQDWCFFAVVHQKESCAVELRT